MPSARRQMIYLGMGIIVLAAAGLAGWLLNDWSRPSRSVRVEETFAGTVVFESGDGRAGCVQADAGQPRICGDFVVPAGTAVKKGDRVLAAHEFVYTHTKGALAYDLLLLYPMNAPS